MEKRKLNVLPKTNKKAISVYSHWGSDTETLDVDIYPKGIEIKPISYSSENYWQSWKREIKGLSNFSKSFVLPLMAIPLAVSGVKAVVDAVKSRKEAKK